MASPRDTLLLASVLLGFACTGSGNDTEPDRLDVGECTKFVDDPEECPRYCSGVELRRGGTGEYFSGDVTARATWTVKDDKVVVTTPMNERRYEIADDGALVGPDGFQHRYQRRPCE